MQRVLISKPGSYKRLHVVAEDTPIPGPSQALVEVHAIGVNYADCIVRMGFYSSANKYVGFPITPGFDFSGRVVQVGEANTSQQVGDQVIGVTRFGAYQSHITVDHDQLFPVPKGWSMARAAAFPTVHLTAWYALCELSKTRPGDRVLIHTAAGGVGMAALALCQILGLESFAVVGRQEKVGAALEAGASHVVCREGGDYWAELSALAPQGFDVVLEGSGATTLRQSYKSLRPTGRMIVYGMGTLLPSNGRRLNPFSLAYRFLRMPRFSPLQMLDDNKTVSAFNLSYLFTEKARLTEAMSALLTWANANALPAPPIATYPLSRVRDAHRDLESMATVGKLVLIPDALNALPESTASGDARECLHAGAASNPEKTL